MSSQGAPFAGSPVCQAPAMAAVQGWGSSSPRWYKCVRTVIQGENSVTNAVKQLLNKSES